MNEYRTRFATTVSSVIWAAFIVPVAAQTSSTTPATHDCRLRDPAAGLLYYAKADYAVEADSNVIANPCICGALLQVIWSEVEKEDGQCDWSDLDAWIEPWARAGKKVAIRIMWSTSGNWPKPYYQTPTPQWVWEKGARYAWHEPSGTEMPLIWDPVYKKYAWRFMEQLAARYDDRRDMLFFDITPGAETNPYRFGTINLRDPQFKNRFAKVTASDGRAYSEQLWLQTVYEWIDASDRIFIRTPLLVTLNVGGIESGDRLATIGAYCVDKGLYVGQNGLRGSSYTDLTSQRAAAFLDWSKRTRLFFEMGAGTGRRTGTLSEVMRAAERINCSYLNVYPEDVKRGTKGDPNYDPEYEAALVYGARVLGKRAADESVHSPVADFQLDGERWTCQADGQPLEGILVKPKGDGPFPAIIISHGLGSTARQFGLSKAREFVKWGFVCIATTYTHTRGSQDRSQFGASEANVRRARACMGILDSLPYVDGERFVAYGNSMGAFLTIGLAAAEPQRIKAAAITAGGVTPMSGFPAPTTETAAKLRTPMLILHGSDDRVVPPQRSELLKSVLDRQLTPNQRHVWEGVGHNLHQTHADEVYAEMRAWFETHGVLPTGNQPTTDSLSTLVSPDDTSRRMNRMGGQVTESRGDSPRGDAGGTRPARGGRSRADGDGPLPWVKPPVVAIRTRHETFDSQAVGAPVSYLIYLPPEYEESNQRYPVLYWLHGIGGAQTGVPRMVARWHEGIEAGRCPPMIVVFVNGLRRSGYIDSADGKSPVETVSIRELIPHIDSKYRTISRREGRIVEGFSMGGAGAAKWGFKFTDVFGGLSILAGALHDAESLQQRGGRFEELYGGSREHFVANDPWTLVRNNVDAIRGRTIVRIVVGSEDGLATRNRAYHELLDELNITHEFHEIEGVRHLHGPLYDRLGDQNWAWYRRALTDPRSPSSSP